MPISGVLEKFYKLRHDFYNHDELDYDSIGYFTSIEKRLKAFNVIKTKRVMTNLLLYCIKNFANALKEYNGYVGDKLSLIQEEFDLLKEELENEK